MLDSLHDGLETELDWDRFPSRVKLPPGWQADTERPVPLPTCMSDLRHFARYPYRTRALVLVTTTLPTLERSGERSVVYTKDVSREGIGFYIDEQLFPRERVQLLLPGRPVQYVRVVRCRKIADLCFEVGSRFD